MEIAKRKDRVESGWLNVTKRQFAALAIPNSKVEGSGTITINFVLLRSPLQSSSDPETVIVSREPDLFGARFNNNLIPLEEFSTSPTLQEVLWNFSRYDDRARITLEQNPHFYLRFPEDESAFTPMFQFHPLRSEAIEHNATVYVLFDGPGRVLLDAEGKLRIFCNVWSLNGFMIFRGSHHFTSSRVLSL